MGKKKAIKKYEGSGLDEESKEPGALTSEMIPEECDQEQVSAVKSDLEQHPKFHKFKGEE